MESPPPPRPLLLDGHAFGKDAAVLCIAAHADDETLLCGGVLARLADCGARVTVLALCGRDPVRRSEFEAACAVLRVRGRMLEYADAGLTDALFPEIAAAAAECLRELQADLVLTHDPVYDYNPDHLFTGRCAAHAAQKAGMHPAGHRPRLVLAGEVHIPLPFPDYLADVTGFEGRMAEAMECHASQLAEAHKQGFYLRLLRARGQWRGAQGGCGSAQAFRRLPLPPIGDLYGAPPAR